MQTITKIKTPFEQAEPAGKELLRMAREEHLKRRESSNKEIYQASKDAASYLVSKARGRVSMVMDGETWERIFGKGKTHA